jgi:NADH:ubiquinone reductase (H+-translocating)
LHLSSKGSFVEMESVSMTLTANASEPVGPPRVTNLPARPKVLIVGGGFAGLHAALGLANKPVNVTLLDKGNRHTFQPLLYQVALAVLSPADIAQPIRSILSKARNINVLMDEVVGFDRRRAILSGGAELGYDYLILATGATHSYFGRDDWAVLAPGLKTIEDATEIRRRVLLAFELAEREMVETGTHPPLNFVIVGGGPTGVELAGAISDMSKLYMQNDFRHIDPASARVLLLEGSSRILPTYPPDLSEKAVAQLRKLGVEVYPDQKVTDVQPGYVMAGDRRFDSVVTLWAAGVAASPLGAKLGVPTDRRGAVIVDRYLNPPGHPEIFVCGDLAHVEENGHLLPGVAQPAMQMGDHAARMIEQDMAAKPRTMFHYFDKGDMATIGHQAAVADVKWPFKAHWGGFLAWATWLVVHIYFLIGFRNRVSVFFQWTWTYFTARRGARLITGSPILPGWDHEHKQGSWVSSQGSAVQPEMPNAVR